MQNIVELFRYRQRVEQLHNWARGIHISLGWAAKFLSTYFAYVFVNFFVICVNRSTFTINIYMFDAVNFALRDFILQNITFAISLYWQCRYIILSVCMVVLLVRVSWKIFAGFFSSKIVQVQFLRPSENSCETRCSYVSSYKQHIAFLS